MKRVLMGFLAAFSLYCTNAFATGSTYSLGTFEGDIGTESVISHVVTVVKDGNLTYSVSGSGDLMPGGYPSYVRLNAADGTTVLKEIYFYQETNYRVQGGLAPGNYVLSVHTSHGLGHYVITTSFTNARDAVTETEPNDTKEQCQVLGDGAAYGTIGHTNKMPGGALYYDHADWLSVDVPGNGVLTITLSGDGALMPGGYPSYVNLFAGDGTTSLGERYFPAEGTESITVPNLSQGTYYVRVYASQGYGSYALSRTFTYALADPTETEANDLMGNADPLIFGATMTGMVGYRNYLAGEDLYWDHNDWYRVDMAGDGRLTLGLWGPVTLMPGGYPSYATLFAANGTTGIAEQYFVPDGQGSLVKDGLSHGTYLVRVYASSGYGAYSMTSAQEPAVSSPTETENNDIRENADALAAATPMTGTIGYGNKLPGADPDFISDINDWFVFTAAESGTLTVTIQGTGNLWVGGFNSYVNLFDHNGTSNIGWSYFNQLGPKTIVKTGATPGPYYVQMYASSGGGFGAYTVTAVLEAPNTPPVISGTPAAQVDQDQPYLFQPAVTDPDAGATHTFAIANKPAWASFSPQTGELSGTPGDADVGVYANITITVTDNRGDSDQLPAFSITVNNVNDPPSISGAPPTQVNEGAAYDFTPSASDPDNESLTFGITNKPAWAQFDTTTGRLWGTPGKSDIGTWAGIVISVADALETRLLPPFSITVNGASSVEGTVSLSIAGYDNLEVRNAIIALEGTSYSTTTAQDGTFALAALPSGTYTLTVSAPGMQPSSVLVNLTPGGAEVLGNLNMEAGTCSQEDLDQAAEEARNEERQRWDANGDNRKGLPEAIDALQTTSGLRGQP